MAQWDAGGFAMRAGAHDHHFHQNKPICSRPPLRWPGGRPLAFSIVISVEYYELQQSEGGFMPANLPGGFGRAPYPDVRAFSMREYGNRVGIFRMLEALDRHSMRATAAIDATVASRYPYIVKALRDRSCEFVGHGISVNRVISDAMTAAQERNYIRRSLDAVEQACGVRPTGWHGPEYGESRRTPHLLAEAAVEYLLDWPNDEQPYFMDTSSGPIIALPMALELDDVICCYQRRVGPDRWQRAVLEAIDQLLEDGTYSGRHLLLNLHPWFVGQPHRIALLENVLAEVHRRSEIWVATAGEIAAAYASQFMPTGSEESESLPKRSDRDALRQRPSRRPRSSRNDRP